MINLLPERLQVSVEEMNVYYPSLQFDGRQIITGGETYWKGWVQPISNLKNLEWILDDINHNQPVQIQDGEVTHHPNCLRNHQKFPFIKLLKKPDQAFNIKIIYSGGKKHPRCFVLQPKIPQNKRKHMFGDGAVCAYPPQINIWNWQTNTVVDFTDQIIVWLVKWNVWNQTGIWLGDETSHSKISLYFSIGDFDQCWCGSGASYRNCHQTMDKTDSQKEIIKIIKAK